MSKGNKPLVFVCAVVVTLSGVAPAHDFVLCIGEEGHVELEPAHEGRCSTAHGAECSDLANLKIDVPHEPDSCCGSCTDIPLFALSPGVELNLPGRRVDTLPTVAFGVCPYKGLSLPSGDSSQECVPTVCRDEWESPPSFRTTVLLI